MVAVSLKDSVKDRSLTRFESVVMLELLTTKATKVELAKDNKYFPRKLVLVQVVLQHPDEGAGGSGGGGAGGGGGCSVGDCAGGVTASWWRSTGD